MEVKRWFQRTRPGANRSGASAVLTAGAMWWKTPHKIWRRCRFTKDVSEHYRFRVQHVILDQGHGFQLRVGMEGERDLEYIPAHRAAFAQRFELKEAHATEAEAHGEK